MTPGELDQTLQQIGQDGIRRVRGDQGEVEVMPASEIIAADRYLASKRTSRKPWKAIKQVKMAPPGGGS